MQHFMEYQPRRGWITGKTDIGGEVRNRAQCELNIMKDCA
jgi:hypothetical protein